MTLASTSPTEVYILEFDANCYTSLITVEEDDVERLRPFDGRPMAADWQPVRMRWAKEDGRGRPDFCAVSGGGLVFSPRAREALGDLLEGRGEWLRLEVDGDADLDVFNVTRLSGALDVGTSEIKRFPDGEILRIKRYEFDRAALAGETIFKLAVHPGMYTHVTDVFRRRSEDAGLTGFLCERRVWPSG